MDDTKADKIIELLTTQNKLLAHTGLLITRLLIWLVGLFIVSYLIQIIFR